MSFYMKETNTLTIYNDLSKLKFMLCNIESNSDEGIYFKTPQDFQKKDSPTSTKSKMAMYFPNMLGKFLEHQTEVFGSFSEIIVSNQLTLLTNLVWK